MKESILVKAIKDVRKLQIVCSLLIDRVEKLEDSNNLKEENGRTKG